MKKPKYEMIKDALRKEITSSHHFNPGDKFYTEAELAKKFNVSSITVIRSLNELVNEGYLVRFQGKGTFISRARKDQPIKFSDEEVFPIKNDHVKVLTLEPGNNPEILKKLNLAKDDTYYIIERVRYNVDDPYIFQKSYIPSVYIDKSDLNPVYYTSIYRRFHEDFNIDMSQQYFRETNDVRLDIPEKVHQELELNPHEPCVYQNRLTVGRDSGNTLEIVHSYKKWNYFKIKIQSNDWE
ncbi:MAG: GntR family transcriptional regulator [Aerococcus suis]|nr:GntR family transcriptional regulator [Aerococcus suis]